MRILLISGSTRSASTNTAALRAMHDHAPAGVDAQWLGDDAGLAALPAFNPDDDGDTVPAPVARLRQAIELADAVLFCTPEYAGTLPGSMKNLLDWTVKGASLYDKPVAYVSVAAEGRGAGAEATLRTVLGYVGARILDDACARVFVAREAVAPDGTIIDLPTLNLLIGALDRVAASATAASVAAAG